MEEREIVDAFWARDGGAVTAAKERYGQQLQRLAERIVGDARDAEECVSDTLLNAWNAIPPERPVHLPAYLAKLCRNAALNRLDWNRAQKRNAEVVSLTAELEACVPDARHAAEVDGRELAELLTAFLRSLPPEQRQMFLRRYWYGDTVREIAKRYGFSDSKVKTALFRTRNQLRDYLEKEGITP